MGDPFTGKAFLSNRRDLTPLRAQITNTAVAENRLDLYPPLPKIELAMWAHYSSMFQIPN
jgi:hypothetical protein